MATKKHIIVDAPFYTIDTATGARGYYATDRNAPGVGDAVKIIAGPDPEDDYEVTFKGDTFFVNREVLVSVDNLVAAYRAAQEATTTASADVQGQPRQAPKVSGSEYLTVDSVAVTLHETTELDGPDIDLAIAYALLRTQGIL